MYRKIEYLKQLQYGTGIEELRKNNYALGQIEQSEIVKSCCINLRSETASEKIIWVNCLIQG